MNDNDNSIFFLTISLVCVWLIVDYVVGKQYIGKFISMLPFMGGESESDKIANDIENNNLWTPTNPDGNPNNTKEWITNGNTKAGQGGTYTTPNGETKYLTPDEMGTMA